MKLKRILAMVLCIAMVLSTMSISVFAEDAPADESALVIDYEVAAEAVAKVGNTEYTTIDEAIAAWTNGTTLTLLSDVTLTDVVSLKSTEHHILDLGTYTMTAASGKNAFVIQACGTGSAERSAITINADATNPGGINAGSKCVVYYKYADGGISTEDRPIIKINGGVFTGSTSSSSWGTTGIYTIGTAARKCATIHITGGTFNCSINGSGKSKLIISGGTFHYSVGSQGDSTALRLISGGTFKTLGFMTADDNNTKFWFGTSMGNSNVGTYIDNNGYLVVGGPVVNEAGDTFEAFSANYSGFSSYLKYSSAANNGLYYTSVKEALADNNNTTGSVTVYVEELDMTGITYKGTIVVPEGKTLKVIKAPENLTVKDTNGNVLVANSNDIFGAADEPEAEAGVIVEGVDVVINPVDGESDSYEITLADGETWTDADSVTMTFPAVEGATDGDSAYIVHEHEGVNYIYVGKVANGSVTITNTVGFSTFTVYDGGLQEALAAAEEGDTITLLAGTHSEGTIKLPATLKNVTIKGEEGAILKDMTIMTSDGNSFSYIGLTFDGITFDNSRLLFTGWRNGEEIVEDLTITNCTFKNLDDTTNEACVHINKDVTEPVNGFTFTNNVIDGATGGSKSGIYTVNTGDVVIRDNTFNNIVFRPALVQLADCDGVEDNVVISNNVISNTTRLQVYGSEADDGMTPIGTDTLAIAINNNIFKNITGYYICTWGINGESDIAENYYDSAELGGRIYWNNIKPADEAGLAELGIYPVYTELNADGTINEESAYIPEITAGLSGEGTIDSPYLISTIGDLKWFRDDVNGGNNYNGKHIKLTADIDLANEEWTPIGYMGKSFLGTFDGGNKTIKNLYINKGLENTSANNGIGFFGRTDDPAVIQNLTIENADVSGSLYVGAIVGMGYTGKKIENCTVKGQIAIDAWWYAGVIGGNGYMSLINNCHVIGENGSYVKGNDGSYIGGIWGFRGEGNNKITDCTVTNISLTGVDRVGGICGIGHYGNTISDCEVNKVAIQATDSDATTVGLIVGACQGTASEPTVFGDNTVTETTAKIGETEVKNLYGTNINGSTPVTNYVAKIGSTMYTSIKDALTAAKAGDEVVLMADVEGDIEVPAGITFNGNGFAVTGTFKALGDITFAGHTKIGVFDFEYTETTFNIGVGACLEIIGTGRMVIGHGCIFNIEGNIADAKTASVADLTPSLIMPGASFTGAGVTFNVKNAYIKTTASYCSSSKSASGTFDFNIENSIWEQYGKLAFEAQSVNATVNFNLKDSVLNTTSHLVFGVTDGNSVIDNSNVNVGNYKQLENRSNLTIKNGSVVNGAVATSDNAKNPGILTVDNATYIATGEFSGSDLGIGKLILKNGATANVAKISKEKATVTLGAGCTLTCATADLAITTDAGYEVKYENGVYTAVKAPVAYIGEQGYESVQAAIDAAKAGDVVTIKEGTYAVPTLKAGITVVGEGNVLLEGTLSGTFENLTLKNLHIKGGNAQRWAYAKGDCVFENVTFEATSVYALHFDGITEGATLLYKDCTIIGWAAMGGSPTSCVFDGCTIKGNGSYGVIRTYFATEIKNCKFDVDNVNTTDIYEDGIHAVDTKIDVKNCTNANGDMKDLLNISGNASVYVDGKLVLAPVAKIGDIYYETLEDAFKAAANGCTIEILSDVVFEGNWDDRNTGSKFTVPVTIDGNNKTIKIIGSLSDPNGPFLFKFEADATVNNLIIDISEVTNTKAVAISAKADITIDGCTFIGNGSSSRGVRFGEGAGANIGEVDATIINSTFTNFSRGISDNENGQDAKTVTITGNTLNNANVYVSAYDTVTFTGNTVTDGYVDIRSYTADNTLDVTATDNNLTVNTEIEYNYIKAGGTVIAQDEFVLHVTNVAKIGDVEYETLEDAVKAAVDGDTITLLSDIELKGTVSTNKSITIDGNNHKITPAKDFAADGNSAALVFANGESDYNSNINCAVKNVTFEGFNGLTRVVRANFCNATIENCIFKYNSVSGDLGGVITSSYATVNVKDCTFDTNTTKFAIINIGSDVSAGTDLIASITGNTFDGNSAETAVVFVASSANMTGNSFNGNIHTGENANAAAILAGPYTGNMSYTININENAFVNAMSKGETALPAVFAEDWSSLGSTTAFDLSSNYWNGNAPAEGYATSGENPDVTLDDYYTTYDNNTLGGLVTIAPAPITNVAKIGDVGYISLADAVAAAKDGEEITLLADITDCVGIKVESGKKNTLDLNGYTISGTCVSSQQYMFIVANEATMTIKDSSETQTGKITYAGNNSTGWIVDVEGKLVLESGTLELTGTWSIGYAVDVRPNAWGTAYTEETSFVMNGGKIVSSDGAVRVASSSADNYDNIAASFTMNGGEIEAAWDGVFVQQSNAVWDVLNVTVNDGTIKSALNPIRFYGPAATSYVNGEDCVDIKLNGGTLAYTGTETQTWLVENIIRLGGGVTADDFMKDSSVIASTAFADANVAEGYKWVESNGVYTLEKEETANPFKDSLLFVGDIAPETYGDEQYHPVYVATSVDSLNYQKVGFKYIFERIEDGIKKVTSYISETKNVYNSISDASKTYTVQDVGGKGIYLFMDRLLFPDSAYHNDNTTVIITPYAIDMDGNEILGWTFNMTNEIYKAFTGKDMFKEEK